MTWTQTRRMKLTHKVCAIISTRIVRVMFFIIRLSRYLKVKVILNKLRFELLEHLRS